MATSQLKDLPKNKTELVEAMSQAVTGNSTTNNSGRRVILTSMLMSEIMNRPFTRPFILLMGCSGAGKSSTVNHIFGFECQTTTKSEEAIASTRDSRSETRIVQEYVYQTESEKFETTNISLGIVDTPGFGDTSGIRQDTSNLYAISDFVHCHMKDKFPNLILVCVNVNDNRYMGPCSNFSKLLKSIRKLNLVDLNKPNVVIVLTHCCSLVPDIKRDVDEWKRKISHIKLAIKHLVWTVFKISVPIIPIENHYTEFRLTRPSRPSGGESDFTKLPDGQLQPYNLFKECSNLLSRNKDMFGHICFTTIFLEGKNLKPTMGNKVESTEGQQLFFPFTKRFRLLNFLEGINSSPPLRNAFKEKSQQFFKKRNLDEDGIQEIESLVDSINHCEFFDENDIDMNSLNILEYYLQRDNWTNIERDFLQNFLKMEVIDPNLEVATQLQCGYHIFSDTLKNKIFNFPTEMKHGLMLPSTASVTNISQTEYFAEIARNDTEFYRKRIYYLHGVELKIRKTDFEYNSRPGFQIISKPTDQASLEQHYHEKWFYQVNLDYSSHSEFTPEFREAVNNLPDKFESENLKQYKKFFETFGHYFIVEAYVGGSYEKSSTKIGCTGGDSKYETLKKPLLMDEAKNWNSSILKYPKLLTTCMHLKSIEEAVGWMNSEKRDALVEALAAIFPKEEEEDEEEEESGSDELSIGRSMTLPILTRKEAVESEQSVGIKILFGIVATLGAIIALPIGIAISPFVAIGVGIKLYMDV